MCRRALLRRLAPFYNIQLESTPTTDCVQYQGNVADSPPCVPGCVCVCACDAVVLVLPSCHRSFVLYRLLLSEAVRLYETAQAQPHGAQLITADNWPADCRLVFDFADPERSDHSHTAAMRRWMAASFMHGRFAWFVFVFSFCVCFSFHTQELTLLCSGPTTSKRWPFT